jgi:hypothetical protein
MDEPAALRDIEPTLEEFQELVGGMIESLPTVPGYANEEGLLIGLPYNMRASTIANHDLVGDVVFTGGVGSDGEDLPVSDEFVGRWFA